GDDHREDPTRRHWRQRERTSNRGGPVASAADGVSRISHRRAVHDDARSGSGASRADGRRAMFVKICGITRLEDADAAVAAGADALGFVFWPKSPRFVDPEFAREISAGVPEAVRLIGVFVDQPAGQVNEIAERVGLTDVQLHGDESLEYVRQMARRVVKAVPMAPDATPVLQRWPDDVTVLLDVHDPVRKGGTGKIIDWVAASRMAKERQVILAGGLTPENVG